MTTIVTRASKGSPLSWSEADANFTNLNDDKAEVSVVALKAPLASPDLTGVPTAPTATNGTNTTQLATTAFVQAKTATQTPSTAVGNIAATNVQDALQELDSEKVGNTGLQTMEGPLIITDNSGQLAGFRNILINGKLTINQRGVTIAAAANGNYGPDRWKKVDASNMTQVVEDGNYSPSTEYTLSGTNVTTQQITSPASGNWTLPNIPITATNVQLEEGSIATPFELRPYGLELELCQRYFERFVTGLAGYVNAAAGQIAPIATFKTEKRAIPTITLISNSVLVNVSNTAFDNISTLGARLIITATAAGTTSLMSLYSAAAEL